MSDSKNLDLKIEYEYGFHDEDVSVYKTEKGLNEETVHMISKIKNEPEWMLDSKIKGVSFFRGTEKS